MVHTRIFTSSFKGIRGNYSHDSKTFHLTWHHSAQIYLSQVKSISSLWSLNLQYHNTNICIKNRHTQHLNPLFSHTNSNALPEKRTWNEIFLNCCVCCFCITRVEERGWTIQNQLAIVETQGNPPNACYVIKGNFHSINLDYNSQKPAQEAIWYGNEKHANVNLCQSLIVIGSFLPSYSECSLA